MIREIKEEELPLLADFLYDAIYLEPGQEKPNRSIIYLPELEIYIKDFGKLVHDHCLVADLNGKVIGAVWTRIMDDYGHIDNETPSFAISIKEGYRGQGIGTKLMQEMLCLLRKKGYQQASLSVQKKNYAYKMYLNVGFKVIDENNEEYIMKIIF